MLGGCRGQGACPEANDCHSGEYEAKQLPAKLLSLGELRGGLRQPLFCSLQMCHPGWFAANVLSHTTKLAALHESLAEALSFSCDATTLMLHATAETSYELQPGSLGTDAPEAAGHMAAVQLPRMPVGLTLVSTARAYAAVAAACRSAASLAAVHDARGVAAAGGRRALGTALRSLLGLPLMQLQRLVEDSQLSTGRTHRAGRQQRLAGADGAPRVPLAGDQSTWKLQAAAAIALLSEELLGASSQWRADFNPGVEVEAASNELESLAESTLKELVNPTIWSLATSGQHPTAELAPGAPARLPGPASAQELGCNALLQRAALECIGTAARALGPRFSARLLHIVLLPVLEKLGDASPLVASGAAAAAGSLCASCGYASLQALIGANTDYMMDGLCKQLRQVGGGPLTCRPRRMRQQLDLI